MAHIFRLIIGNISKFEQFDRHGFVSPIEFMRNNNFAEGLKTQGSAKNQK
jgi:hypothetical protein